MNALNAIHNNGIPGANLNAFVNALMGQVLNQQPLAQLPAQLLNQVKEIVRNHILALAGTLLSATGLAVLLPTLTGIIVNALGFTSAGVVAGSYSCISAKLYHVSNPFQLGLCIRYFRCVVPVAILRCIYRRSILLAAVDWGYGGCCITCGASPWWNFFGSWSRILWTVVMESVQILETRPR